MGHTSGQNIDLKYPSNAGFFESGFNPHFLKKSHQNPGPTCIMLDGPKRLMGDQRTTG